VLNGTASYSSQEVAISNAPTGVNSRTTVRLNTTSWSALLAIRRVIVASEIVDLSFAAGIVVGRISMSGDNLDPAEYISYAQTGSSSTAYGVIAALAVDRRLLEALYVRAAINFASAQWAKVHTVDMGNSSNPPVSETSGWRIGLALQPSVELRFLF
jgi:hypothetical protein